MRMEENITSRVISTVIWFQRLFITLILMQALLNITDNYNLKQLITEPTRITPYSSTLIDVIFTNIADNTTCSGVSHIGISDHRLIVVYRKISSPPVIKGTSTITYYAGQTESEIRPRTMSSVFIGACGFVDWETGHEWNSPRGPPRGTPTLSAFSSSHDANGVKEQPWADSSWIKL